MRKVSEYQEHAAECRKMARQTRNEEHKKTLEDMAQAWDMLAKEREKQQLANEKKSN
jgi:hypothetical protein